MSKGATKANQWKKAGQTTELELPSGNTCLVRTVGLEVFVQQGMIPNSLMEIVGKALKAGDKPDDIDPDEMMAEVLQHPEKLQDMFAVADRITLHCVVEPRVLPPPDDPEDREEDKLYVDEVDMEDKMFIFNFAVGGSRDLEAFREAAAPGMGSVPDVDVVQLPAEPAAGSDGELSSVLSEPGGEVLRGEPEQSP